jgi:hypothetical protein
MTGRNEGEALTAIVADSLFMSISYVNLLARHFYNDKQRLTLLSR